MSYTLYPVIPTEPQCNDYEVKINGEVAPTNTARVSAIPFNRRWPGHQRQIEQTEAVQFLSLSMTGPVSFEITPSAAFDPKAVKIRPKSLGITPEIKDGKIRFTLEKPAYFTVEAYGRSRALHIFADPETDYGIKPTDGGVLYFGAGEHDVGLIELRSGQTLYLDEGAVLYASIHAIDAENIRILGHGILDNSRNKEEILYEANAVANDAAINNAKRRHTIQLEYCNNVEIDGITIRDSLVYNVRPVACNGLEIRNVKIIGCWRFNSDGIDMHNCVDVHISDCFLRTYDDSICVKGFDCYYDEDVEQAVHDAMYRGGKSYDVFKNVLVERCVIWNDWGVCLEIGAETRAEEITNILFFDCDLIHLTGPVLDASNVDYADVHGVTFEQIRVEADEIIPKPMLQRSDAHEYENEDLSYMPPLFGSRVIYHPEYSAGGTRRGKNRDITYKNIRLYGDHRPSAALTGYDAEHRCENIRIENLYVNDTLVRDICEIDLEIGDFVENVRYTTT